MALDQLEDFMAGIRTVESGSPQGVYSARNPSGAYGAYQIMPSNWDSWADQAGIPGASPQDPAAQDRVARQTMSRYYQKYGSWDLVAVAWRAGPAVADRVKAEGWGAFEEATSALDLEEMQDYIERVMGTLTSPVRYPGPAGTAPEAPFNASGMLAHMLNQMSLRVAGGTRLPVTGLSSLSEGLNTRALATTAPDLVPTEAEGRQLPNSVGAEGAEDPVAWSSGRTASHTHSTNEARLGDPDYQKVATGLVSPIGNYVAETWGVEVQQYREIGYRPPGGAEFSDHYWGGALDIIVTDIAKGNAIEEFFKANAGVLGVNYTLWQTENHYDHVHVSFLPPGSSGAVTDGLGALTTLGLAEEATISKPIEVKSKQQVGPDVGAYTKPTVPGNVR